MVFFNAISRLRSITVRGGILGFSFDGCFLTAKCAGDLIRMFFEFEADFVDSLRCIPMVVRLKLDSCGVKLKLAEWNHFTQFECAELVNLPCAASAEVRAYRDYLSGLIFRHTGNTASLMEIDPHPDWLNERDIPSNIQIKAAEYGVIITQSQWANLTPLQRFAAIKLTRSSHENNNFLPALEEFGLVKSETSH
jgi:hypothetical protein